MIWPAIACVGALCLAGRRRRSSTGRSLPAPRRGQSCPPMPWLGDAITQVMLEQYHAGIEDPALLAVASLRAVYPTASDGQSLRWPTNPADCAEKRILESRVILRAQRLVAEAFDVRAEELWYREGGT